MLAATRRREKGVVFWRPGGAQRKRGAPKEALRE